MNIKGMDGEAIVYCQGAFNTPNGKTAHGLIRFTDRYQVISVVDSNYAGGDAGEILDGKTNGIRLYGSVPEAVDAARKTGRHPSHFVIGIAPDGGAMNDVMKADIILAIKSGLHVDSGLHDFLSDDHDILRLAVLNKVGIRDIRKPPDRRQLHFFTGNIARVKSLKIAVLGTDSAVGKRTTAWLLVWMLRERKVRTEMIGTGQTAWMQGVRYGMILDSLVNDFLSGEIEHAVCRCWDKEHPEVMVIEGQGSLLNPAYPGGYEIIAASRPDTIILQHAPARKEYDGFPGFPIEPLEYQVRALEIISGKKVLAVTLNHEQLERKDLSPVKDSIMNETGLRSFDLLWEEADDLADMICELVAVIK